MATSDGLTEELLREGGRETNASREGGVAVAAVKWAIWLPMCVLFGMHVAMLVVWPVASLEKMRTMLLLMAVQKVGFAGRRAFRVELLYSEKFPTYCIKF